MLKFEEKQESVQKVCNFLKRKRPHICEAPSLLVENTGFEPVTSCLPGKRSSQLS